jgi:hypothetical protein
MGFAIDETVFYLAAGAVLLPVLLLVASLGLGPFARRRGKKWYCRAS